MTQSELEEWITDIEAYGEEMHVLAYAHAERMTAKRAELLLTAWVERGVLVVERRPTLYRGVYSGVVYRLAPKTDALPEP